MQAGVAGATPLETAAALLAAHEDVLVTRVDSTTPPPWVAQRGWTAFLLSLSDEEVALAERSGLWSIADREAPADLVDACRSVRELITEFEAGPRPTHSYERENVPRRKRPQIAALITHLRAQLEDSDVDRIVDVGAGHGHLARAAHQALRQEVLAVDHDGDRIEVARSLADRAIRFVTGSADDISLSTRDLVVGLHACGALGDTMIREAANAGSGVFLVSCCQHKITTPERTALSETGRGLGLTFPRHLLGLSNLSWGTSASAGMRGRRVRHSLRLLLESRGVETSRGDAARGVHKRRFRRNLEAVAAQALRHRDLSDPTPAELAHFDRLGTEEFGVMRRLSLPRNMLGRAMELAIVLDRGQFLAEAGYTVHLRAAFHPDISPRNLALAAHRGPSPR